MGASDWTDPHDIIPESFRDRFGDCESVDEALAVAEQQPSSTPEHEQRKCKVCGSLRIRHKSGHTEMPHKRPEDWKCTNCGEHQDDPITPNDPDTMHGTGTTDDRKPFDWMNSNRLKDPDKRTPVLSQLDDEVLTALAIRAYEPWTDGGASYREIAAVLPYSRQWVGERVRAWRDGEHRELVADPSADDGPTADSDPFEYGRVAATDGGRRRRCRWAAYGSG